MRAKREEALILQLIARAALTAIATDSRFRTGKAPGNPRHTGQVFETYQIVELAEKGESNAEQCLMRYEQRLAKALAGLVNTLDPDIIVLGGGMSNIERLYTNVRPMMCDWVFGKECVTQTRGS